MLQKSQKPKRAFGCSDGNVKIDLEKVLPELLGFYENVDGIVNDDMSQLQSLLELNRYTVRENTYNNLHRRYCSYQSHQAILVSQTSCLSAFPLTAE